MIIIIIIIIIIILSSSQTYSYLPVLVGLGVNEFTVGKLKVSVGRKVFNSGYASREITITNEEVRKD